MAHSVGRTVRQLFICITDHNPDRLNWSGSSMLSNAILADPLETSHNLDRNQALRVICQVSPNRSKQIRIRTFGSAEVLMIRHRNAWFMSYLSWPTRAHTHTHLHNTVIRITVSRAECRLRFKYLILFIDVTALRPTLLRNKYPVKLRARTHLNEIVLIILHPVRVSGIVT